MMGVFELQAIHTSQSAPLTANPCLHQSNSPFLKETDYGMSLGQFTLTRHDYKPLCEAHCLQTSWSVSIHLGVAMQLNG